MAWTGAEEINKGVPCLLCTCALQSPRGGKLEQSERLTSTRPTSPAVLNEFGGDYTCGYFGFEEIFRLDPHEVSGALCK